ncbi:probable E3 ubiquitin-protein ligase HERC4 isoform X1 [Temnothorax curvispinosus]|uniref:Probable E3 ubiquitin-protein ligase HERC4 isoform X1 n=2 Tax=Temnothorax curvispinosus TaxID=300111 RepID=A0A6J1QK12_9HYME|nr:probable E3 ubiquitin-protein ligase HERC4 isoform X1 [Temnothorax curvispinosus]XP_024882779.1 probable E3 ubiquitin-protein ligase HERC4 isoform X1 [Temnothorax curvispinosus]
MASRSRKRSVDESDTVVHIVVKRFKYCGIMFCWGSTIHGELGLGGIEDENIFMPREVDFTEAKNVVQIACGENYSVAITKDGQVYSCGNNDYGQLGHEKARKRLQLIPGLDAFVFRKIACGNCHTLAVNEWGQLFSWGCNVNGQLGLNIVESTERVPRMVKVLGANVIVQIACGVEHSIALTNDGELYAWGSNRDGQLGLGSYTSNEIKPKRITTLAAVPIAFVACGGYHTVVISKSGAVFSWGRNTFGQLGLNDTQQRCLPCQLRTLRNSKVCYATCGEDFSVFLTMDGGVFTCGAGMYGQLGHGNNSNEILPRQVMELMGSTVTQVSCGKRHTLALVPSRGRVYAWGLGGAGQLGNRSPQSATTPQVVLGPWSSPSGSSMVLDLHYSPQIDCVVKHIFSGGDHCFATISQKKDNIEPDDCRILGSTSQILTVTEEKLGDCQRIPPGSPINHELMTYLETVFKSQACINASFLLSNDAHYGCSSKNHGIDIDYAIRLFGIISELDNNTIQELIFTCVTDSLIPSFVDSPPDVESLRVYLTLPLYHRFANLSNYSSLQTPFCKAVLKLKAEACKVVGIWWSAAPPYYFERLVRMYKSVVLHFVKQSTADKIIMWTESLQCALQLLALLYKLNVTAGIRVPYETFHLSELSEYVDINRDYLKWLTEDDRTYYRKIYFCNYPFLFDAEAKTTLLETDQAIQMQSAMNEAASRVVRDLMLGTAILNFEQYSQFVVLHVSRNNIVNDTLQQLFKYDSSELKRPLRVKFRDEEAEDVGGVRKEFFMLLFAEILDFKYGMFKEYEETRTIWFSSDSLEEEDMYFLIGVLCGLAIYNFVIINLPFPLVLYKKLLGESVGLSDVKDMSPTIARSLEDLLEYNESDLEEAFCLNFMVTREVFGEMKNFELIPGGENVPVTLKNKQQYVDLYVDYILNKSVETQFKAFHKGFHNVCGGRVLELFHSHELMLLLIGNENYDWEELEKNATYKDGYTKSDPTIVLFWQVFHELSLEDKKKFLLFLTGSDRIPIHGMKAIKITIQPMTDERFLPAAHTCFNLLDLPRYQTRERLKYKLLQAIQQNQGFSLV